MKDASVGLDGCCPTNTAAAQRGSLHQAPHPPKPPPLLTAVQQLDPRGALLADMPTHTAHHGARTQRAQASHKRQQCDIDPGTSEAKRCVRFGMCLDHSDAQTS